LKDEKKKQTQVRKAGATEEWGKKKKAAPWTQPLRHKA
jgi:hypothetical protein